DLVEPVRGKLLGRQDFLDVEGRRGFGHEISKEIEGTLITKAPTAVNINPSPRTSTPYSGHRQRALLGPFVGTASERGTRPASLEPRCTMGFRALRARCRWLRPSSNPTSTENQTHGFGRFAPVVASQNPIQPLCCPRCRAGPAVGRDPPPPEPIQQK